MKRLVVLTATRAEYGLLKPLIQKLGMDSDIDERVAVTGMHLSPEFGMTVHEIENDGIRIDKKIEILMSSDTPIALSKSMGLAMISFSEYFEESAPDGLIVLGDRFETLAVCCAAMNARIPILHIHGGEATEGLIDEAVRHSITKMSYLHFASTERYKKRIIQMGEAPDRVFCVGALGVENAMNTKLFSLDELENSLGIELGDNYSVGTYHPVTLENNTAEQQIDELISALDRHSQTTYLFTMTNADTDGRIINKRLRQYADRRSNFYLIDSLGLTRYLSALKYARYVIGNSSSGLIEAPSFHIPTIDIGDRQKGRIAGPTVIHCGPTADSIDQAIAKAEDETFVLGIRSAENPYGNGNASDRMISIIKDFLINGRIDIKKKFYDIDFGYGT